jgi:hypothetical protein
VDARTFLSLPAALVGLLGLVLAGCTSGEAVLTVTFDGTSCSYDGPSEIGAGVAGLARGGPRWRRSCRVWLGR